MRRYAVLVAEPNVLVKEKIANLIGRHDDVWCVAEVGEGLEVLLEAARRLQPDIVLADLAVWRTAGACEAVRAICAATATYALVEHCETAYVDAARHLGLDGVVEKARVGEFLQQGFGSLISSQGLR
jgi:DNA-binding NarL/FixJ family response regulator